MKKIYLSALALSIGTLTFGQHLKPNVGNPFEIQKNNDFSSLKGFNNLPNDKGVTLWSNSFDTPTDSAAWTIVSPTNDWIIGSVGPAGAFPSPLIASTSGGNSALFDSDLFCALSDDASITLNTPVNLSANPAVSLQFEQMYRNFNDDTYIGVSTNGGTSWTEIQVNSSVGVNVSTTNPELLTVNISTLAGGQANVLIRFRFEATAGCAYSWQVDDVKIIEADANDLSMTDPYYGVAAYPYSRIPVNQIQPIEFTCKVENKGAVDQTNTVLTADINSGAFSTTSPGQTVTVGSIDSLVAATWTPPVTTGVPYILTLTVASDSTDISPIDNTSGAFDPFEITDHIYAYDDFGTPGTGGGDNGGVSEFEAGNSFDIFVTDQLYAIDVVIGTGTSVGTSLEGVLYERNFPGFTKIATSPFYSTTAGDVGNVVHLEFNSPVTVDPNKTYFVAVHALTTFNYGTSGTSPNGSGTASQTSLIFYPTMDNPNTGQNFFTSSTPMVRMNFDPILSVDDLEKDVLFNVFPNPSNGVFNINLEYSKGNTAQLSVKNIVGQTIISKTITVSGQTKETISLADYSKGVYFLTVNNETVKLIVE